MDLKEIEQKLSSMSEEELKELEKKIKDSERETSSIVIVDLDAYAKQIHRLSDDDLRRTRSSLRYLIHKKIDTCKPADKLEIVDREILNRKI